MIELADMIETMHVIKDDGNDFYMKVTVPGCPLPETIVNPFENLAGKIGYYKEVYDQDGVHKHNKDVKIVDYGLFEFRDWQ